MKILVTGSLAFDYIMDFPGSFEENILPNKLKTLSVSFLAKNFSKNFGGVAGNIAYNLALLKQKSIILASAGKKDFNLYEKHLEKVNVDTSLINKVNNEFSANMFMITDKNNCQIAGFYPGAMSKDSNLIINSSHNFSFAVISPTVPIAMSNFVQQLKKLNILYLYDPAQQIPRISKEELIEGINGAEIVIANDYELALIMKKTGFSKNEVLKKVKILITTLGEKGSLIETFDKKVLVGIAKPKQIIDPTGAGDAYIAGFVYGYLNNYDLKTCGQIGATLSSCAIEKYGTQNHNFNLEEFKKRYQENFRNSFGFS